jgi:hypothetical protein
LVVRLREAYAGGSLEKTLASILKAELLILDEWGYMPIDKHGAQLLFRIISDSYERRSLVITTNTELSKWGSILTCDQITAAMIDRPTQHGRILLLRGTAGGRPPRLSPFGPPGLARRGVRSQRTLSALMASFSFIFGTERREGWQRRGSPSTRRTSS